MGQLCADTLLNCAIKNFGSTKEISKILEDVCFNLLEDGALKACIKVFIEQGWQ